MRYVEECIGDQLLSEGRDSVSVHFVWNLLFNRFGAGGRFFLLLLPKCLGILFFVAAMFSLRYLRYCCYINSNNLDWKLCLLLICVFPGFIPAWCLILKAVVITGFLVWYCYEWKTYGTCDYLYGLQCKFVLNALCLTWLVYGSVPDPAVMLYLTNSNSPDLTIHIMFLEVFK